MVPHKRLTCGYMDLQNWKKEEKNIFKNIKYIAVAAVV